MLLIQTMGDLAYRLSVQESYDVPQGIATLPLMTRAPTCQPPHCPLHLVSRLVRNVSWVS